MYSDDFMAQLYKTLYTIRTFENQCIQLYRQGLIVGYFHPYLGEEAIATGVCAALQENDYIVSTHRGHGHCIARGGKLNKMVAELLGKETGYCRGRGGSMHIADIDTGNLGANGIVGGGIPIGVGAGLGISIRETDQVVAIFFSDGASNNGVFAESVNLAAIWCLPVIFVLENNNYAVSTSVEECSLTCDLHQRAEGYCVRTASIDGNDVLAVYEEAKKAVENCRSGKGPILIECKTYRHGGHHVNDPGTYMPQDKLEYYRSEHDPLKIAREQFDLSDSHIADLEAEVDKKMEEAIEFAKNSPEPSLDEFLEEVAWY